MNDVIYLAPEVYLEQERDPDSVDPFSHIPIGRTCKVNPGTVNEEALWL